MIPEVLAGNVVVFVDDTFAPLRIVVGSARAAQPPNSMSVTSHNAEVAFVHVCVVASDAPARRHHISTRRAPAEPCAVNCVHDPFVDDTLSDPRITIAIIALPFVGVAPNVAVGFVDVAELLTDCTTVTPVVSIVVRLE